MCVYFSLVHTNSVGTIMCRVCVCAYVVNVKVAGIINIFSNRLWND